MSGGYLGLRLGLGQECRVAVNLVNLFISMLTLLSARVREISYRLLRLGGARILWPMF